MSPNRLKKTLVSPDCSIEGVIRLLDESGLEIALVVDEDRLLLGTVTDGDIRRAILRGVPLDSPVEDIMNRKFTALPVGASRKEALRVMKEKSIRQIPLVDADGRIKDLLLQKEILREGDRPNWAVIMAGGLGKRLRPLTDEIPKPMLNVGGQPLLQTIVEQLAEHGFHNVLISLNYKAHVIESYFGNGSAFGINIQYIHEDQPLGTAGALELARDQLTQPFLVLNGDILTTINYGQLLQYHQEHGFTITACTKKYDLTVPYGVLDLEDIRINAIREKPLLEFFISAGIYCMDPVVLDFIPQGRPYDVPQLIKELIQAGRTVGGFPIREYWLDIGHPEDYARANTDIFAIRDVKEA